MSKEKEIEMLKEKLDYYTLVAADDEFDAGKVIKIVKSSISDINNHMSSSFNNMIDYVGRSGETIVLIVELKKLINFE